MKTEYEARVFIDDIEGLLQQFHELSFNYCYAVFQRRNVYDLMPVQKGKWLRLRTDGKTTTLTYKEIQNDGISGTSEVEIEVSDFNTTAELLSKIGYTPRSYQENFRIHYTFNDISYDIDFWPGLPPYLEIESSSERNVVTLFSSLGFTAEQLISQNVDKIYLNRLNMDLDQIAVLDFTANEKKYLHELMEIIGNVK